MTPPTALTPDEQAFYDMTMKRLEMAAMVSSDVLVQAFVIIRRLDALVSAVRAEQLTLDDYEVANLTAALRAIAGHKGDGTWTWDGDEWRSPLGSLNTGDWVCQILSKLRKVAAASNKTPEQARADARAEVNAARAEQREAILKVISTGGWITRGDLVSLIRSQR